MRVRNSEKAPRVGFGVNSNRVGRRSRLGENDLNDGSQRGEIMVECKDGKQDTHLSRFDDRHVPPGCVRTILFDQGVTDDRVLAHLESFRATSSMLRRFKSPFPTLNDSHTIQLLWKTTLGSRDATRPSSRD